MPLIVDANRASDFQAPQKFHALDILWRIAKKRLRIVLGGKLTRELFNTKLRDLLVEWERTGSLIRISDEKCDDETKICKSMQLNSDDEHILALARTSNARLIYTDDQALIKDFKNPTIVNPRGKVIMTATKEKVAGQLFDRYGC